MKVRLLLLIAGLLLMMPLAVPAPVFFFAIEPGLHWDRLRLQWRNYSDVTFQIQKRPSSKGAFLGHAGDGFGYRCLVGHSPQLNATVLFVINTDTGWDFSGFVRMVDGWKAI
jgi:hypothetical protein